MLSTFKLLKKFIESSEHSAAKVNLANKYSAIYALADMLSENAIETSDIEDCDFISDDTIYVKFSNKNNASDIAKKSVTDNLYGHPSHRFKFKISTSKKTAQITFSEIENEEDDDD